MIQRQDLAVDAAKYSLLLTDWFGRDNLGVTDLRGVGNPAAFVDNMNDDTDFVYYLGFGDPEESYPVTGYFTFGEVNVRPSGFHLTFKTRGTLQMSFYGADLYFLTSQNPGLASNVWVAWYSGFYITPYSDVDWNLDQVKMNIVELNRTEIDAAIPGVYPTLIFRGNNETVSISGFQISAFELSVSGEPVGDAVVAESTGIPPPFYTIGHLTSNSGLSYYMSGEPTDVSGYLNFYTSASASQTGFLSFYSYGHATSNSGLPFYVADIGSHTGFLPFYVAGGYIVNSGFSMYTSGLGSSNAGMNFYTSGFGSTAATGVPFFMWATTNSGVSKTFPLYMEVGNTNRLNALPFYIGGPESESISGHLNFVLSSTPTTSNVLPFYLSNEYRSSESGVPLYITTPSGTDGAVPINSYINLFMGREAEGRFHGLPFFMKTVEPVNSSVPFSVEGTYNVVESGFALFMSGFGIIDESFSMKIEGF